MKYYNAWGGSSKLANWALVLFVILQMILMVSIIIREFDTLKGQQFFGMGIILFFYVIFLNHIKDDLI